jgi:GH15 family glucan-1,4-alpha-glucosidase
VLVTRFFSTDGVGQITDFMPVGVRKGDPGYEWLIRRVTVSRGSMKFRAVCRPAFDYARAPHKVGRAKGCVRFRSKRLTLELSTEAPIHLDDGSVTSEFTLKEGEGVSFVLRPADGVGGGSGCVSDAEAQGLFESTVEYWRRWLSAARISAAGARWCIAPRWP